jgi:hypothetical protein
VTRGERRFSLASTVTYSVSRGLRRSLALSRRDELHEAAARARALLWFGVPSPWLYCASRFKERPMQTLRRAVAVLTFPAIAWLGAACERTDTPTEAPALVAVVAQAFPAGVDLVVDKDGLASTTDCNAITTAYTTIGAAVTDAAPGDTIGVCPATYTENVDVNVMNLTLVGAQAGQPVLTRVFGGPFESTVIGISTMGDNPVFEVTAPNVTIDGFSVRDIIALTGSAIGIGVKVSVSGANGSGALVKNNIIDGVITPDLNSASSAQAIYLQQGPDNVVISGNAMSNIRSDRSAKGVFIGDATGSTNSSDNVLIIGNSISNVTSDSRGAYGVLINRGRGTVANSGLIIRNNTITTLAGTGLFNPSWVHAIGLEANTPGVLVRDNSITALVNSSPDVVAVFFEDNPTYATGMVIQNNFNVTPAAYGIAVNPGTATGDVDGTCNWWGDPTGPGPVGPSLAGAKVSPRVDYTPWLSAPSPNGACIGGQPSTPGKVTGGGQIDGDPVFAVDGVLLSLPALVPSLSDPNSQANFGFVVQQAEGEESPRGNLEYNDHGAGVRIKAISFDKLVISDGACGLQTHAEFTGMATVENQTGPHTEPLTVKVDDCGNPGTMGDKFGITTVPSYSNGPSVLIGGNIKIH